MPKAFAYLRVSGKGQVDGDGFPRQIEAVRAYANSHDVRIVKMFREQGVSGGKDLEHRPALIEMMEALNDSGVKTVMIEKLDRLARDLMIQESLLLDLRRKGVELISVSEPDLCSDEPTRKLMRQMLGAFAEYEKSMIVMKLRSARQRVKAKLGRCEGAKPYGSLPGELEVIGRMKRLRTAGLGFDRIAAALNDDGILPRRSTVRGRPPRWHGFVVNRILSADSST